MNRRKTLQSIAAAAAGVALRPDLMAQAPAASFQFTYVLSSALYGDMKLADILPEVPKSGAVGLDIWGKPHGTQREELDGIGVERFADMLREAKTTLAVSTRYPLGCFGLQPEMPVLKALGGKVIVCGATKPSEPTGAEAIAAVKDFLEKMKPHADAAGEHGLVIAVENHAGQLLHTPDSVRAFADLNTHPALGVAFAPHHLHEWTDQIPGLIRGLGDRNLPFVYFQEYGIGSKQTVAKDVEMEQLPGRGTLDYKPIVRALRDIGFTGYAEIFMHPTPRGTPILPSAPEITAVINQSRAYIDRCIAETI